MTLQPLKSLAKRSAFLRRFYRKRVKPLRKQWEPEIYIIRKLAGAAIDTVLDIGANTGVYAVEFSKIARRVIAFEPVARCADELVELGVGNIDVVKAAASDRAGARMLNIPLRDGRLQTEETYLHDGLRPDDGAETERIEARLVRLDDFLKNAAPSRIDFIKVDVEGHERQVLDGARKTIAEFLPPLLVEIEQRHNAAYRDVFTLLEDCGYMSFYSPDGIALKAGSAHDLPTLQAAFESRAYARGETKCYINNFFFLPEGSSPANTVLRRMII